MTIADLVLTLFCSIDDGIKDVPNHPQSHFYPRKIVTLAILFAIESNF